MSLVSKVVDPNAALFGKQVTFTDADFSANDILDIVSSLKRGSYRVTISTEANASITVKVNSYKIIYPQKSEYKTTVMPLFVPDLTSGGSILNSNAPDYTVSNGEELILEGPVSYLEVTALTAGSGITIKAI
jgi:nitrate reductase beta subunit